MLVAAGFTNMQIVEATGYSTTRIFQLKGDPSFKQLVAEFRPRAEEIQQQKIDEYYTLLFENGVKAERMIGEHLDRVDEEDGDLIPISRLLAISRDTADRVGYGKHATQTNKIVDFAKMIEQAQAAKGMGSVIDARSGDYSQRTHALTPAGERPHTSPQVEQTAVTGLRRRL